MSNQAANPAAPPYLSLQLALRALPNPTSVRVHTNLRSSSGGPSYAEVPPRPSATFLDRHADENFSSVDVCRSVSRLLFGHRFGANPAPCGSSLFCFHCVALRVTVSLQIMFGEYAEKISPDPP
jgi:hypothetical protein